MKSFGCVPQGAGLLPFPPAGGSGALLGHDLCAGKRRTQDSSSAAIVACGLLEAAKYVDETEAAQWRTLARQMLASLTANYAVKPGTPLVPASCCTALTAKSPYNTCTPEGVDECTSWGDYFYMEA